MPTEDVMVFPLEPDPLVLVVDDELTPRAIIARMVRSLGTGPGAARVAWPPSGF